MICKVKNTIEKYSLLDSSVRTVAVGLSGGADSVCLLDVLNRLKDEYSFTLKAVHVNHKIRGDEAERDELFVKELCRKKGIELLVFSKDIPALAKERRLSLEECGRQVRYECFQKCGCDAVAVAHTLSDSIETMIFNLARGTGAKGLTGISPKREPDIIRPLIECTREEIEAYCNNNSISFVTDSTNLSDDYTRNHIRHNIVPAFKKINTDFEASFLRAMYSVKEEDDFVNACAEELLKECKNEAGEYNIQILSESDDAVLKKFILKILREKMKKPPEAKHIEACFDLIKSGKGKIELSKDLYILADNGIISFNRSHCEKKPWKAFVENSVAEIPSGVIELIPSDEITADAFDEDKVKNELFFSSRLPGDSFTFRNRKVTKSLKKLFNEMKIPEDRRNDIAVLHDGENVVWIEDIGVNSMYIPDDNSQKILKIKRTGKNA